MTAVKLYVPGPPPLATPMHYNKYDECSLSKHFSNVVATGMEKVLILLVFHGHKFLKLLINSEEKSKNFVQVLQPVRTEA